jgi:hypothetical protein
MPYWELMSRKAPATVSGTADHAVIRWSRSRVRTAAGTLINAVIARPAQTKNDHGYASTTVRDHRRYQAINPVSVAAPSTISGT